MTRSVLRGVAVAVVSLLVAAPGVLADGPSTNPDPNPDPGPTKAETAVLAQKQQMVDDYLSALKGKLSFTVVAAEIAALGGKGAAARSSVTPTVLVSAAFLNVNQYPQINPSYCGPSAVYSILRYEGVSSGPAGESLSQKNLGSKCGAGYLCTDWDKGTSWFHSNAYPRPVVSTLNTWAHTSWYAAQSGATNYVSDMIVDIMNGYPVAVNVYEQASRITAHLANHPRDRQIWHWVAAIGYDQYGARTYYADPVHGSTVSWAGPVAAFGWVLSSGVGGMTEMLATRGFVW